MIVYHETTTVLLTKWYVPDSKSNGTSIITILWPIKKLYKTWVNISILIFGWVILLRAFLFCSLLKTISPEYI